MTPKTRRRLATIHLWLSIIGGIAGVIWLAHDTYERVLLGISFYAITITAWDVLNTADVRVQQDES